MTREEALIRNAAIDETLESFQPVFNAIIEARNAAQAAADAYQRYCMEIQQRQLTNLKAAQQNEP